MDGIAGNDVGVVLRNRVVGRPVESTVVNFISIVSPNRISPRYINVLLLTLNDFFAEPIAVPNL